MAKEKKVAVDAKKVVKKVAKKAKETVAKITRGVYSNRGKH